MGQSVATNFYERLVENHLAKEAAPRAEITDDNILKDIVCLALNMLPPRYIRHEVDMAFFLCDDEREVMEAKVCDAVDRAIEIVTESPR